MSRSPFTNLVELRREKGSDVLEIQNEFELNSPFITINEFKEDKDILGEEILTDNFDDSESEEYYFGSNLGTTSISTEQYVSLEKEFPSIYPAIEGISPFAIQAKKQWKRKGNDLRPEAWQGKVYGLVVHTTGGSLPGKAISAGMYPSITAINTYFQTYGCHYINGWKGIMGGDLIQVANEKKEAWGVGMGDQIRSINNNRFEKDLPSSAFKLWKSRWQGFSSPIELLPKTQTANSCYIHVECPPVVYSLHNKTVVDSANPPMRPGLRFTKAQHDSIAILAYDIAIRNGWPMDQKWWKTSRLLGHEDLAPLNRHDCSLNKVACNKLPIDQFNKKECWDPGGLRNKPYFDWDYVYHQIEMIHKNGFEAMLKYPIRIATELNGQYQSHSGLFEKEFRTSREIESVQKGPYEYLLNHENEKNISTSPNNSFNNESLYEDQIDNLDERNFKDETEWENIENEQIHYEIDTEEEYDELEQSELFESEMEENFDNFEDEISIDRKEWEEDSLETERTSTYSEDPNHFLELNSSAVYDENETLISNEDSVSDLTYSNWYKSVIDSKTRFPNEPAFNIDQLPLPPWINSNTFYQEFIQKYGSEATTIIGDASKKVNARYFVLHDTAVAAEFTEDRIKGKGIHLWVNAKSPVVMGNDWQEKGLGVKLERSKNNSFVHIEITRDKELERAVQKKTNGKKVSYDQIIKEGGIRNFGTYYTDKQYELIAYAYIVASLRKRKFLTITIHREVDRSVVVKRKNNTYGHGHNDPQFFDLDYFYSIVCKLLKIPGKVTFGIQSVRALAHNQGNMAGYENMFIPFVVGEVNSANQYGELRLLNPRNTKFKVIKLKYGYYYDVTHLKNQLQVNETTNEIGYGDSEYFSSESFEVISGDVNSLALPAIISEDHSVPGYTCYVKIELGKGNYPLNMTGIYIPSTFDPRKPIDLILYLHGITSTFPGDCAKIDDYWSQTELPKYDLRIREEINTSGKNVVLVAPSLGKSPNSYKNSLSASNGGLDNYFDKVTKAINEYVVIKRYNANAINIRHIILAAHSAGGRQMRMIANLNNPIFNSKISECWGFDSLYDGVNSWIAWATNNKDKKLILYYKSSTEGNAKLLESKSKNLENVFIKKSSAKNHYWVPKEHLQERVTKIGRTDLTKSDFEDYLEVEDPNVNDELEALKKNWSYAIRQNNYYSNILGWGQFYDQINNLLLPFYGQQNVSLGEESFAQSVAAWQLQQGFSASESDGIIGPQTWSKMKTQINLTSSTPSNLLVNRSISPVIDPVISSEFSNQRKHPGTGNLVAHYGIDIVDVDRTKTLGKTVVSATDGTIASVKSKSDGNGAGNRIHIIDTAGYKHSYFHLSDNNFAAGLISGIKVKMGQKIGEIGNTGRSSGPHLHYETIHPDGTKMNPRVINSGLRMALNKHEVREFEYEFEYS